MVCTKCHQPIAIYHRTKNGPHHLQCPPSVEAVRKLLVDADSALSLIFHRKGRALEELDDSGDFKREVEALVSALRKTTEELSSDQCVAIPAHGSWDKARRTK